MASKELEDKLREAVREASRSSIEEHGGEPGMIMAEIVVIAAFQGWDSANGEPLSQVVILPMDGPNHRINGLLHEARIRMEADILGDYIG